MRAVSVPAVSIIVPALNEAENLRPLAERVHAAMAGRAYELIIVDDNSPDDTPTVCAELATIFPLKLIVRPSPKDGLSGAVLTGLRVALGEYVVVMDADLQHPPEKIPDLLSPLDHGEADFVLGSRYAPGGTIEEGWTPYRALNSRLATLLARPFAGKVRDPMSGFFAMRRDDYLHAKRLTPLGYKIALELLTKSRVKRVKEVPIHFGKRLAGASKLSLKEQFRYLEHLSRLYDFAFPRLVPVLKFLIVTAIAWAIAIAYFFTARPADWPALPGVAISYLYVIFVTAIFHLRYVRAQREFLVRPSPWRDFFLAAGAEWATCVAVAAYLIHRAGVAHELEVVVISFAAALVARYVLRKELMLDVRGLRHEVRKDEMQN